MGLCFYNAIKSAKDKMKNQDYKPPTEQHDEIMINRIKCDLIDWLTTYGEVTMGCEMVSDVQAIVDDSVERTKRIREGWATPDRC